MNSKVLLDSTGWSFLVTFHHFALVKLLQTLSAFWNFSQTTICKHWYKTEFAQLHVLNLDMNTVLAIFFFRLRVSATHFFRWRQQYSWALSSWIDAWTNASMGTHISIPMLSKKLLTYSCVHVWHAYLLNECDKDTNKYVSMDLRHIYLYMVNIYYIFAASLLFPEYQCCVKYFKAGKKRVTTQYIKLSFMRSSQKYMLIK